MKRIGILLLVLASAGSSIAMAETKDEKLYRLAIAQGLDEMYEQSMAQGREGALKIGEQAMNQMFSNLNPDPEARKRMENALSKFLNNSLPNSSKEDAINSWAKAYGKYVSEPEIDKLLEHYNSDLGKKDVAASKAASQALNSFILDSMSNQINAAAAQYVKDLNLIAAECNCAKKGK